MFESTVLLAIVFSGLLILMMRMNSVAKVRMPLKARVPEKNNAAAQRRDFNYRR